MSIKLSSKQTESSGKSSERSLPRRGAELLVVDTLSQLVSGWFIDADGQQDVARATIFRCSWP